MDGLRTGRLAIYEMDLTCGGIACTLILAVLYGWTGGQAGSTACERTDDLCRVMWEELKCHPPGPKMVAGDINGEIADFETLADMMGQHGWTDAGATQHICPQGVCMPTCRVSGVTQATRRDYVLVNEYLLPAVVECKVCYDDTFPTHSPVSVAIASAKVPTQRRRLRQVDSAATAIQEKMQSCIGNKTGKEAADEKKAQVERLHAYMNMKFEKRTDRMQEAQGQADAHRLWDLITAAVEESFVRYLELAG